ncbi:MAG: homoserine dehydrogenase [Enterococcus sp.]|nr:homoserine dehydrogenase [Enterococcus sp.]
MKNFGIGIVGTGTVGCGVIDIVKRHAKSYPVDLHIAKLCSRRSVQAEKYGLASIYTTDFNKLVSSPDVDIVVELIGGTDTAYNVVKSALLAGKHVVTANKALIASKGKELLDLAYQQNLCLYFEAAVGGAVPLIDPLRRILKSNKITKIEGILNGTTNFILDLMLNKNLSYEDALKQAQDNGFAEADPSADVDGHDCAAKIAILASIAFGKFVCIDDVSTQGIRDIALSELLEAKENGRVLKLLAVAENSSSGISVSVKPTCLEMSHELSRVDGVYNAACFNGDFFGKALMYGEGAGAGPAASSVVADIINVAKAACLDNPSFDNIVFGQKATINNQ